MIRKIWRIRQLVPTKFATVSRPTLGPGVRRYQVEIKLNVDATSVEDAERQMFAVTRDYCGSIGEPVDVTENVTRPQFVRWWMWLGRSFKVRRTAI